MPLLKAKLALSKMSPGEFLQLEATDAGSVRDFATFTDQSGHRLVESEERAGVFYYLIEKGQ